MSGPSRRDFVAALLGVPFALSCRASARHLPDGDLLVPGKVAGHRLRDSPAPVEPPERAWQTAEVVVVGGGAAGLAAAWWLARAGMQDVCVLELDEAAGGTSRAGASAITAHPWGAHYIVAPRPHQASLIALLGELGALEAEPNTRTPVFGAEPLVAEQAVCRDPEERLFYRGRWYEGLYPWPGASARDRAQLERFQSEIGRWVAFRDARGRRAFALPRSGASDDAEVTALDRISFGGWLDAQGLDSQRLRWLTDYACRDDYGLLARDTSAWAGIGYFAARIKEPGDEPQPVVTWPEGNARLTDALARPLGARLRLNTVVCRVDQKPEGVEVRAMGPEGPVGIRARRAILATPEYVTERILRSPEANSRPRVVSDRGAWAVANLHLDQRPRTRAREAPLSWDNVFYASPSLGYVVATHQAGRDYGPTVLTWYYPFTGDGAGARRELDSASREEWATVALADVSRAHPDLAEHCRRIDVAYWGHGMVRPRPGSVFDPARRAAIAPLGVVHFASSELSGVSLFEEALDHGVRAAEEVLLALGHRA